MNCDSILQKNPKCAKSSDTVKQAAQLMKDNDVGFLPSCEGKRVMGTVTDRDIVLRVVADGKSPETVLSDFGLNEPVTCTPNTSLEDAQNLMKKHKISRLVCVSDTREIQGVISLQDISEKLSPEAVGSVTQGIKGQSEARPS